MTKPEKLTTIDERTGPFYDLKGLCTWLGKTFDEIFNEVFNRRIIAAATVEGNLIFPVWQFETDGTVNPELLNAAGILFRAEVNADRLATQSPAYSYKPGNGWFTLSYLVMDFPFGPKDGYENSEYKDAEILPIYQHLKNGSFLDDIMWEIQDQHYRLVSP